MDEHYNIIISGDMFMAIEGATEIDNVCFKKLLHLLDMNQLREIIDGDETIDHNESFIYKAMLDSPVDLYKPFLNSGKYIDIKHVNIYSLINHYCKLYSIRRQEFLDLLCQNEFRDNMLLGFEFKCKKCLERVLSHLNCDLKKYSIVFVY